MSSSAGCSHALVWEHSDPLPVADGRCRHSALFRQFSNGHRLDLKLTSSFTIEAMKFTILAVTALSILSAQTGNPLSREAKDAYTTIKNDILKSAEKMPEENYGFKPAPKVRTFGQILGHVAEEQYFYCSAVKGEQKAADIEKTKTSKADLLAALR